MSDDELSKQYEDEIAEASAAFSGPDQLDGVELHPYTTDRAWAARAMGLQYGFVDAAGVDVHKRTGLYPSAARDVGIVLWLRSLTSDTEIDKAARSPIAAVKKAGEWARSVGISDPCNPKFGTAYDIFLQTMDEVAKADTAPKK